MFAINMIDRFLVVILLSLLMFTACSTANDAGETKSSDHNKKNEKEEKKDKSEEEVSTSARPPQTSTGECDASLWQRVYDPQRLEVLAECKVVTGTIVEQDQNEDGDTHMLLKLDPGQDDLLAKKNYKKKDGNLVIEVVCAHPPSDKKARKACEGYETPVSIPLVNDHVRVTGSYVNDTHNGWTEIHPVSKIEKL